MGLHARAVLIAGPTASGKSALAVRMARDLDAMVVNADSMQVYRELSIITARPSPQDEAEVPHRLYGHRSATEPYSVGRWLDDVGAVLAEARARDRPVVIVGGTGLYFKALLDGLSPIPAIDPAIRQRLRERAAEAGAPAMHAELARRDPETAARLKPGDAQRIVRALEVLEQTGTSISEWQRIPGQPLAHVAAEDHLVVHRDRADLNTRVRTRLEQMLAEGALEEAQDFAALGIAADAPAARAIGLRPFMALAAGTMSRETALDAAAVETQQYVKRQRTWINGHMRTWNHVFL